MQDLAQPVPRWMKRLPSGAGAQEMSEAFRSRPSRLAHISAGLVLSALLGVLCFRFPELLTRNDGNVSSYAAPPMAGRG